MKSWYAAPIPCPECDTAVTPVFRQGFYRIPDHDNVALDEPCHANNMRVIAP